jgi:glycosyltransferase involved in cell wall biosynthesis
MQLCEEVANGLFDKGHQITVLTSKYKHGDEVIFPYKVHRVLDLSPDYFCGKTAAKQFFFGRKQRETKALENLKQMIDLCKPNIIFIFHGIGLPRQMFQYCEQLPGLKVVYYLAGYLPDLPDEYLHYWNSKPTHQKSKFIKPLLKSLAKRLLMREGKPIQLKYNYVICVSQFVRNYLVGKHLIPSESVVIHNGIDIQAFNNKTLSYRMNGSAQTKFLVAGNIIPEKGIHTVIDSADLLKAWGKKFQLTILGNGPTDYLELLKTKTDHHLLNDCIQFRPGVSREQVPEILKSHDVFILSSVYAEPLARSIQEAMAVGMLVIGTVTGGSGELLVHEQTGLVFEAGNTLGLAEQMKRVMENPDEMRAIARTGKETVVNSFNINKTILNIENYLLDICNERK